MDHSLTGHPVMSCCGSRNPLLAAPAPGGARKRPRFGNPPNTIADGLYTKSAAIASRDAKKLSDCQIGKNGPSACRGKSCRTAARPLRETGLVEMRRQRRNRASPSGTGRQMLDRRDARPDLCVQRPNETIRHVSFKKWKKRRKALAKKNSCM